MIRMSCQLLALVLLTLAGARAVAAEDAGVVPDPPAALQGELVNEGSYSAAYDDNGYFFSTTVDMPFTEAVAKAREELKRLGFGILTEIDFQAKMKEKLDKDLPPYLILGACHPGLAYEVYSLEEWIGIMMPCNVVVRELADGTVMVGIKNSLMLPMATGNDELAGPAQTVNDLTLDFIISMGL